MVTWGPWAHVRHPIYLAGILVNLGAAMIIGTVLMVSEFIGYTLFETLFDTPREEQSLRKIFPDEYEEYSKRVPRWIPRIRKERMHDTINILDITSLDCNGRCS